MEIQNLIQQSMTEFIQVEAMKVYKEKYITGMSEITDSQYDVEKMHNTFLKQQVVRTAADLYESLKYEDATSYVLQPYVSGLEVEYHYEDGVLKSVVNALGLDILTDALREKSGGWNLVQVSHKIAKIKGFLYSEETYTSNLEFFENLNDDDYSTACFVATDVELTYKALNLSQGIKLLNENGIATLPYKTVYLEKIQEPDDLYNVINNFRIEAGSLDYSGFVFRHKDRLIVYQSDGPLVYDNIIISVDWRSEFKEGRNVYVPYGLFAHTSVTDIGELSEICLESLQTLLRYQIKEGSEVHFVVGSRAYICTEDGSFIS